MDVRSHLILKRRVIPARIRSTYRLSVTEEDDPFCLSPEMITLLEEIPPFPSARSRAYRLYTTLESRITYGEERRERGIGYRNGEEVLRDREGICGEMSFLYVTMARCLGLRASYVSVRKDHEGRNVHHACAGFYDRRLVLVDIAYHRFDITHRTYTINSDKEAKEKYQQWR